MDEGHGSYLRKEELFFFIEEAGAGESNLTFLALGEHEGDPLSLRLRREGDEDGRAGEREDLRPL